MYLQKLDLVRPLLGMVFVGQQSQGQATLLFFAAHAAEIPLVSWLSVGW